MPLATPTCRPPRCWRWQRSRARALGVDHQAGTLEAGKLADLVAVALPDHDTADPHELLFDGTLPVVATWHRGVMHTKREDGVNQGEIGNT